MSFPAATSAKPRYIADTHLGHAKIIEYCARPYRSVDEMDIALLTALRVAEAFGGPLYHLGDVGRNLKQITARLGWLDHPKQATLLLGNHDPDKERRAQHQAFGRLIGREATWATNTLLVDDTVFDVPVRVLLSHAPQRDLQGADIQLFGHVHNHMYRFPERFPLDEWAWLWTSTRHYCVSAEVVGYTPRTLEEIVHLPRPTPPAAQHKPVR
jgi:calcineurin-like phosphoesterase family protein